MPLPPLAPYGTPAAAGTPAAGGDPALGGSPTAGPDPALGGSPTVGAGPAVGGQPAGQYTPTAQLPPWYAGPVASVPPPRRGSNAGLIVALVLAVLLLLCGGGAAVAYLVLRKPVADAMAGAATAQRTRLAAPKTLAGRPKINRKDLQAKIDAGVAGIKQGVPRATSTVGAAYGNPAKRDLIIVMGVSTYIPDPRTALDAFTRGMNGELGITDMTSIPPGPLGGVAKCGEFTADGGGRSTACTWADEGSLCTVFFHFKTLKYAKGQFVKIRGAIEKRT